MLPVDASASVPTLTSAQVHPQHGSATQAPTVRHAGAIACAESRKAAALSSNVVPKCTGSVIQQSRRQSRRARQDHATYRGRLLTQFKRLSTVLDGTPGSSSKKDTASIIEGAISYLQSGTARTECTNLEDTRVSWHNALVANAKATDRSCSTVGTAPMLAQVVPQTQIGAVHWQCQRGVAPSHAGNHNRIFAGLDRR